MKKIFLLITLVGFTLLAKAQSTDFHAFKFDIGSGYALPQGASGTQSGATVTFQPHYRLSNDFALGFRFEAAVIGYENSVTGDVKFSALASGCLTGEYYFSDGSFRPFMGAGIGIFDQETASANVNNGNSNVSVSDRVSNFGGFPEVGFETGHFRLSVDYNVAGNNSDYLAFKVGFFFGGGHK
jgi:outer membrane protein W